MAVKIENMPSPSVLMNSMRSIGYTFKTALADIVDNSISACAKNVYIEIPINDDNLNVTILDDGKGMSRDDKIVKNSDWYVSASYIKPFIVPYTISKIICNLPIGYCLDYDLIWRKQELYPSLNRQIEKVAHITNDFIQQSNGSAREYCSKEDT